MGFVFAFTTGGMTGVLLSIAPVDFQVHNSLFLIAHFHSMVIGGVLFGFLAGITYWFPKFAGFKLNEKLGKYAAYCWIVGFFVAFMPLYILGLMGATRRLDHYETVTGWQPLFIVAAIGAAIIFVGVGFQLLQIYVSIKQRKENMDVTGDPWNGRTLEWSTTSPPPFYNFAITPEVDHIDAFWEMKHAKSKKKKPKYDMIHMPKNTSLGIFVGVFAFLSCFGFIWHMMWLAGLGAIGILVCMIIRLADKEPDYFVSAAEVERIEATHLN